jgi:hypothetical protein
VVLALLAEAGNRSHESDDETAVLSPPLRAATSDRERKITWQRLRRAGQLPPSWLQVIFRVLWHAKLREHRWSAARIAHFLGFPSARHLRLSIARRLGVGFKCLRRLTYQQTLQWAADVLTAPSGPARPRSVRSLTEGLTETGEMRLP